MKKIFILALLLLTLCCHASAASSIQIDNVTSKEVNNYIVNFITASGQNYILDSATECGLVFTATHVRENFLGIQVATQQSKLNYYPERQQRRTFNQRSRNALLQQRRC